MKHSKRFRYFQPNKKDIKDKTGDCQIRALCKALDLTWIEAFDLTIPLCRELQTYTIFDCNLDKTKEAMARLGFEYSGVSNKRGTVRPTVDSFAQDHPDGIFIAKVAHHVVAVVDGCYYDTWDSGHCSMYGYYALTGQRPEKPERLTKWNGTKWILPQGRTADGQSYWRIIADRLAEYENRVY